MLQIEIWTLLGCGKCELLKAYLIDKQLPFSERDLTGLRSGEIHDDDALAELALHDNQAPLIRVNGHFITLLALPEVLREARDGHA